MGLDFGWVDGLLEGRPLGRFEGFDDGVRLGCPVG